jgi:diketogulonate reductase-like aldo/keto reductase
MVVAYAATGESENSYCTYQSRYDYWSQRAGYAVVRKDPIIVALAQKYNVTPTQIILSWHIGRGTGLVVKSENVSRQEENLNVSLEMGVPSFPL